MEAEPGFWKEVVEIILNGMKFSHFIGYFLVALLGVVVFFMVQLWSSIKYDKRSPDKFNWIYFLKTATPRIVIGFICIWAAIVYYSDLSVKLLNSDVPLKLTGFIAFCLGVGIDSLIKGILEIGKHSTKIIKSVNGG